MVSLRAGSPLSYAHKLQRAKQSSESLMKRCQDNGYHACMLL